MAGKNWYILRNHRVEGPHKIEDLKAMAAVGQISPDDYLIDEANYRLGKMVYQKMMSQLDISDFKNGLAVPEGVSERSSGIKATASENSQSSVSSIPSVGSSSSHQDHEVVSSFESSTSGMSFGKVASFCVAVIVGMWGYDNFVATDGSRAVRVPANSNAQVKKTIKPGVQVRKSVILSQPKSEQVTSRRVKKLAPSDRPATRPALAPSTRPSGNESPSDNIATSDLDPRDAIRSLNPDRLDDVRSRQGGRGTASDRGANGFDVDGGFDDNPPMDLPPGELTPPPEEFQDDENNFDDDDIIDEDF